MDPAHENAEKQPAVSFSHRVADEEQLCCVGSVCSCLIHARVVGDVILVVSSSTQIEVEHSERHQGFFTLSSRLFPSLFKLLVKL